jgi:hypothetical protein
MSGYTTVSYIRFLTLHVTQLKLGVHLNAWVRSNGNLSQSVFGPKNVLVTVKLKKYAASAFAEWKTR